MPRRGALTGLGVRAAAVHCDVTNPNAVAELFEAAAALGPVVSVIHAAGVSPGMGDADYVMRTNALGTVNVNEAFFAIAGEGSVIVNVASMAAYLMPEELHSGSANSPGADRRSRLRRRDAGVVRDRPGGGPAPGCPTR